MEFDSVAQSPILVQRLQNTFLRTSKIYDKVLFDEEDVLDYMLKIQYYYQPNPDYLAHTQDNNIKPWMRRDLVEWMMEVNEQNNFNAETLALAVNFVDRTLSIFKVSVSYVQLVAAAALLIASKIKESRPLTLEGLCISLDHAYRVREVMKMEVIMLDKLEWDMNAVVPHDVLEQLLYRLYLSTEQAATLRKYTQAFVDMSFTEYHFLRQTPSMIAAAGLTCSLEFCGYNFSSFAIDIASILGVDVREIQFCCYQMKELYFSLMPENQTVKSSQECFDSNLETNSVQANPHKQLHTPPNVLDNAMMFDICEDVVY